MTTTAQTIAHRVAEVLEAKMLTDILNVEAVDRFGVNLVVADREALAAIIAEAIGPDVIELPPEPAWNDGVKVPVVAKVVSRRVVARATARGRVGDIDPRAQAAMDDLLNTSTHLGNVVERSVEEVDKGLRSVISNATGALRELHTLGRLPISSGFTDFDSGLKRIQSAREAAATIDAVHTQAYREARRRDGES